MLSQYRKTITPALIALVGVAGTYIADGTFDRAALSVAIVGALQTSISFFTANVPGYGAAKAVLGALAGSVVTAGVWIEQGTWTREATAAAVSAVVLSLLTYGVSNTDAPEFVEANTAVTKGPQGYAP